MSAMQRNKGKAGEREISGIIRDLTGWDVKRKVRQHERDADLEGIPGWTAEVKRHATATDGQIRGWWAQAVSQASANIPVLFYRSNRAEWKAVWPLAPLMQIQSSDMWSGMEWTATTSVSAWATVAREINFVRGG